MPGTSEEATVAISKEEKRQISKLKVVESVPRMVALVLQNHTQALSTFSYELVLAICWEEHFWQNTRQDGNGPAVGYGQLEFDGRRIAKQHLTGNPRETDSFPFSAEAILAVPEFSIAAVSHCLAGLFERNGTKQAALNGYAGVKQRPENATAVRHWKNCADKLAGFVTDPLSFTPEGVEDALRLARGFPSSGALYDHIHARLWPPVDLAAVIGQRQLFTSTEGADVWSLQLLMNDVPRADLLSTSTLPPLKVDGFFGSKTHGRVKEFQARNGLTSDGIVGPKTSAKLKQKAALLTA